MTSQKWYVKSSLVRYLLCVFSIVGLWACNNPNTDELISSGPYATLIDNQYRVIGDLYAYGIYESLDRKQLSYITLIPGVGISGPEIAFKKEIEQGRHLKILSAWKERGLFYKDIYYLVEIEDADFSLVAPVRLELTRGNEGDDGGLNTRVYEEISGR